VIILSIRTDNPQAEIGLFNDDSKLKYITWEAHRTLVDTIHVQIKKLLESQKKGWSDVEGIVIFKGPGSFTGLRIGITVANTYAYIQKIPIVGVSGDNWIHEGVEKLLNNSDDHIVLPEYGADVNITKPKK
jgi:tRNA threonylcarbamoyladenosine biosynthesis protein TsaB